MKLAHIVGVPLLCAVEESEGEMEAVEESEGEMEAEGSAEERDGCHVLLFKVLRLRV